MRNPTLPQRPAVSPSEQLMALSWFAEHGDLLDPDLPLYWADAPGAVRWMLVPVSAAVLRVLAMIGAEDADCEPDVDREPDVDDEDDVAPATTSDQVLPRQVRRRNSTLQTKSQGDAA